MNIKNPAYEEQKMNWDMFTFPINAGTPIGQNGCEENNGLAIGITTQIIPQRPLMDKTLILVGGDVVLAEVEAEYGNTLDAEAKKAMSGIKFYTSDGTPDADPIYTIPTASATKLGGVKVGNGLKMTGDKIGVDPAANVSKAAGEAPTKEEFDALVDALIAAKLMEAGE